MDEDVTAKDKSTKTRENVTTRDKNKRYYKKGFGFTNWLAIVIMFFLFMGLAGGFYLALRSINSAYTGALLCWTVAFTPIGTACGIVLSRIVDKSRAENTSANGDGIKYATAMAHNFEETYYFNSSNDYGNDSQQI